MWNIINIQQKYRNFSSFGIQNISLGFCSCRMHTAELKVGAAQRHSQGARAPLIQIPRNLTEILQQINIFLTRNYAKSSTSFLVFFPLLSLC